MGRFWESLQKGLGTTLHFSLADHSQTDGQTERTNQTLEDILHACVLDFGKDWEKHLPVCEFAYNKSYHSSVGMTPFEALYGRKCRIPICWEEIGVRSFYGPSIISETSEKVKLIHDRLKVSRSRQKSYADLRRRDLQFQKGDSVFLKVSPVSGTMRFGHKGKLERRYIGPFEISHRVGEVAYRLKLPGQLSRIHNAFHVSMLRKYIFSPSHVPPYQPLDVQEYATYVEQPVKIVDTKDHVLRKKTIHWVKVQYEHHSER